MHCVMCSTGSTQQLSVFVAISFFMQNLLCSLYIRQHIKSCIYLYNKSQMRHSNTLQQGSDENVITISSFPEDNRRATPEECSRGEMKLFDLVAERKLIYFPVTHVETENSRNQNGVDLIIDDESSGIRSESKNYSMLIVDEAGAESRMKVKTEEIHVSGFDVREEEVEEDSIDVKEEHSVDINNVKGEIVPNVSMSIPSVYPDSQFLVDCRNCFQQSNIEKDISTRTELSETYVPENCSNGERTNYDLIAKKEFVVLAAADEETNNSEGSNEVDFNSDITPERLEMKCNSYNTGIVSRKDVNSEDISMHKSDVYNEKVKNESIDIKEENFTDINVNIPEGGTIPNMRSSEKIERGPSSSLGRSENEISPSRCVTNSTEVIVNDVQKFHCNLCGKFFSMTNELQKHQKVHAGVHRLFCDVCGKSYSRKDYLTFHQRTHAGFPSYSCSICEKSFYRRGHLTAHVRRHSGVRPFGCNFCEKSYTSKRDLVFHEKCHSGMRSFCCSTCGMLFYVERDLVSHEILHTGINSVSCDICGKSFPLKRYLAYHIKRHLEPSQFTCNICGRSFCRKYVFLRHLRMHLGIRPFSCKVCKKSFRDKTDFTDHERTHSGTRPFSCSTCGKSFIRKDRLIKHKTIHTRIKMFSCDTCGKSFSSKCNVVDHIKKSHVINTQSIIHTG